MQATHVHSNSSNYPAVNRNPHDSSASLEIELSIRIIDLNRLLYS